MDSSPITSSLSNPSSLLSCCNKRYYSLIEINKISSIQIEETFHLMRNQIVLFCNFFQNLSLYLVKEFNRKTNKINLLSNEFYENLNKIKE